MTPRAPTPVVVVGARGRMGRFTCELLERAEGFALAAALDRDDELGPALAESGAALGIDFTVAGLGYEHGLALLAAGIRPVIGTSGVGPEQTRALDRRARELGSGGLVVPNFSLGIQVLQRAALLAAEVFREVEVLDLHHERKADAPSGTALDTIERLADALGVEPGVIPRHSVRLPGLYAHHELVFGGPGETLTLRHDMRGPEAFAPGILLALRHARTAVGVAHGLGAALGPRWPGDPG